jgi:outer membrane protein TolC
MKLLVMKANKILFAFLGLVASAPAFARNLSVDRAIDLVLVQSQDIKKAEANIKKMQATADSVNSRRLFQVEATATYAYSPDVADLNIWGGTNMTGALQSGGLGSSMVRIPHIGTAGISATQTIYTFGKIGYALDMVEKSVELAKTSRRLAEIEMRAAAVQLYWSAKMTDELVKIAEKSLKNTNEAKRKLTSTGRANRSNLVKISADVASREIDLSNAKFNRDSAHRMLKAYAGIDDGESLVLVSDFPDRFETKQAKEIKPLEWDIYSKQAEIFDAEKMKSYMNWLPSIAAFGKYDYQTFSMDGANKLTDLYRHSASVGLSISVPLTDWGVARHVATESAMSAAAVSEDLDKSRMLKSAEYADLIQKYGHLRGLLKDLLEAKDLADKAYKLSVDRFLAGQTSATELSDVERASAQAEAAVFNAKLQLLTTAESIRKYEI